MKKNIYYYFCLVLLVKSFSASAQNKILRGTVLDDRDIPIEGATIRSESYSLVSMTDEKGRFELSLPPNLTQLIITSVGYKGDTIAVSSSANNITFKMQPSAFVMNEVVVSTGYQTMPPERAPGSFTSVDNDLLNRSTSTDILSRLENVSSGLAVDKRFSGAPSLRIRGISTIDSESKPLIIVDNFPFEGDINTINPNDIENVTLLKDAAAASIWGARAGNGVIVITTKKGKAGQVMAVTLNSTITVGEKPNLYYQKEFMDSPDFIEYEKILFGEGYYNSLEKSNRFPALTPVVELLIKERDGLISSDEAEEKINAFKNIDLRKDVSKYFYRKPINQQYHLSIRGGGEKTSLFLGAGFDRNLDALVRNEMNRTSLNVLTSYLPVKNLEISNNIVYSGNRSTSNSGIISSVFGTAAKMYPYARLADDDGRHIPVTKDFNTKYIDGAEDKGLLNWQLFPLDDLANADWTGKIQNIRINNLVKYKIIPELNFEMRYQFENQGISNRHLKTVDLYSTRDMINKYAQLDKIGGYTFPVPKGSILDLDHQTMVAHSGRGQLNYTNNWNNIHDLNILGGIEVRQAQITGNQNRIYGYNEEVLTFKTVDYIGQYSTSPSGSRLRIPVGTSLQEMVDRNVSYYLNLGYSYRNNYLLSGSIRKDESNLFGVEANQKGVPLWSLGLAWILSNERFYPISETLPYLKLRTTYGYSGNVNKNYTAYTTGQYRTGNPGNNLSFIQLMTPPNAHLRWEKVGMTNVGLDFSFRNNILSGSIEYYKKEANDLIGKSPLAPSAGFNVAGRFEFIGNHASMSSKGVDLQLNSKIRFGNIGWDAFLLFNYYTDKIIEYDFESSVTSYFLDYTPAVPGKPRFGIYALKWSGLDAATGDPIVVIGGEERKDFSTIFGSLTKEDLEYIGPGVPTHFGSFRNNFSWKNLTLGFNISYKFGHYFRRSSINYNGLVNNWAGHSDFTERWQNPGDEMFTDVPSMPKVGTSNNRNLLYGYSDILISKGDNIRFQDINISFDLFKERYSFIPFSKVTVYGYVNNLGILWKANKDNLDPDNIYGFYPPVRTYSLGLKFKI